MKDNEYLQGQRYEMPPNEAFSLNNKGYVFLWVDKQEHSKGEPNIRTYLFLGKHKK